MLFTAHMIVTSLLMTIGFPVLLLTSHGYIFFINSKWNYVSVSPSVHFHFYFVFSPPESTQSMFANISSLLTFFLLRFCFCSVCSVHLFFRTMLAVKFVWAASPDFVRATFSHLLWAMILCRMYLYETIVLKMM